MNILCDFHHSDLWWSHHLIFESALGHNLYRPRGMEWFERGYYNFGRRDIAKQFLVDSMFPLEAAAQYQSVKAKLPKNGDPGLRTSMDTIAGCQHYPLFKTLSFDEFTAAKIDVIMVTLGDNQDSWLRLRNGYKPAAKLLREEGNVNGWAALHPEYQNLLTSDLPTFQRSQVKNKVLYHQRFDTDKVFTYKPPAQFDRVTCFMPGFRTTPELVAFAEKHDFGRMEFVDYGHSSKRGFLSTKDSFAEKMGSTTFVWHVKPGGDGFGHVIHNSFAMGRPVITVADDYMGSIVWPLLLDRKTCILIGKDPAENSRKIRELSDHGTISAMSEAAVKRFRDVVDYEWETEQVRRLIEGLV